MTSAPRSVSSKLMMAKGKAPAKKGPEIQVLDVPKSTALPFASEPQNQYLDPSVAGYAGFDPFGFTFAINEEGAVNTFKWYRESEIVHGRVAQLAVVGTFFPAWAHFPGNPSIGVPEDAFAELNPTKVLSTVPATGLGQIVLAILAIELFRVQRVFFEGKPAGDLGLGQGGWNPFNFAYSEEEYFEKQVQEIKHGRLAMFGALGCLLQAGKSGIPVSQQLSEAFSMPARDEILSGNGVLGDFFPPNL